MANVPAETMSENENCMARLRKNEEKVFNQDEPIDTIIDELIISKAGLKDDTQWVHFWYLHDGTGKTHTSKELAKNLGIPSLNMIN